LIIKLVRILSRLPGHVMITPSKETTELVFENGSNSRGVSIPVNTQPFTNIASNSGEFPTARCTEWLKKDYADRFDTSRDTFGVALVIVCSK